VKDLIPKGYYVVEDADGERLVKKPPQEAIRRFHAFNGLFFHRLENGSVRIVQTKDGLELKEGGEIVFDVTIDDGTWGSIVLTMSAFNERPNDWDKWMAHHQGRKDLLSENK
jgi:hypothetical protein